MASDWVVDLGKRFALGVGEGLLELYLKHEGTKAKEAPKVGHVWTHAGRYGSLDPEFCVYCRRSKDSNGFAPEECEGARPRGETVIHGRR